MEYVLKTSGLMCAHCDAKAEAALLDLEGVVEADADHTEQAVRVECESTVDPSDLAAAVRGASSTFDVLSVEEV